MRSSTHAITHGEDESILWTFLTMLVAPLCTSSTPALSNILRDLTPTSKFISYCIGADATRGLHGTCWPQGRSGQGRPVLSPRHDFSSRPLHRSREFLHSNTYNALTKGSLQDHDPLVRNFVLNMTKKRGGCPESQDRPWASTSAFAGALAAEEGRKRSLGGQKA